MASASVGMRRTVQLALHLQGLPQVELRLLVVAAIAGVDTEVGDAFRDGGMDFAISLAADPQGLLDQRFGPCRIRR